jgi:lysophospholipase L1-like esterase
MNALYNPQPIEDIRGFAAPANTIAFLGDSITDNIMDTPEEPDSDQSIPHAHFYATGPFTWANVMMRHKYRPIYEGGVSGNTTTQILARVNEIIAQRPAWCMVHGGINDIVAGVSAATITANLQSIYEELTRNQIRVIVATVLPCTAVNTAGLKAVLQSVNRWIKEYAWNHPNCILVDWYHVIADPATGDPAANMTTDGTHPAAPGAALLGDFLYDILNPLVPDIDLLPNSIQDTADNVIGNGFFAGDVAGVATDWATNLGTAPITPSKVARTDGKPGVWQQIQATGAGSVNLSYLTTSGIGTKVNIGDRVYFQIEFETDDDFVGLTKFQARIDFLNASNAVIALSGDNLLISGKGNANMRMASGVFRTPEMMVVADTAKFLAYFQLVFAGDGCGGTVRVCRAEIRKVNY